MESVCDISANPTNEEQHAALSCPAFGVTLDGKNLSTTDSSQTEHNYKTTASGFSSTDVTGYVKWQCGSGTKDTQVTVKWNSTNCDKLKGEVKLTDLKGAQTLVFDGNGSGYETYSIASPGAVTAMNVALEDLMGISKGASDYESVTGTATPKTLTLKAGENATINVNATCKASTAKPTVTVEWSGDGCSGVQGTVRLNFKDYELDFGGWSEPSGSKVYTVDPGTYSVTTTTVSTRKDGTGSNPSIGDWEIGREYTITPKSITLSAGGSATITVKTSCGDTTTTPATQTLTVKISATSPCVDSIDKFTLNISGPTTISDVVTGSSYTNENMKSGSYNVRAGNAGIQYDGRGIYPVPITWDNTSFTLNEGGNYTLTGKVNYCEGSCCPDTTTKGKVKVNVNLTGVNWTSFTVKTPAGTFTKLSTELELSPGTYNFSPTGGIEFNVKEDGKNYSCSKSTGASNKYYCDPSASPSSLTVQAGKSYTVNINIPVEDQEEATPSSCSVDFIPVVTANFSNYQSSYADGIPKISNVRIELTADGGNGDYHSYQSPTNGEGSMIPSRQSFTLKHGVTYKVFLAQKHWYVCQNQGGTFNRCNWHSAYPGVSKPDTITVDCSRTDNAFTIQCADEKKIK